MNDIFIQSKVVIRIYEKDSLQFILQILFLNNATNLIFNS
jgi:hypothetical protein